MKNVLIIDTLTDLQIKMIETKVGRKIISKPVVVWNSVGKRTDIDVNFIYPGCLLYVYSKLNTRIFTSNEFQFIKSIDPYFPIQLSHLASTPKSVLTYYEKNPPQDICARFDEII